MKFEEYIEGLTILNSCLVERFEFSDDMSRYFLSKRPTVAQRGRLSRLGFICISEVDDQEPSGKSWEFGL